MFSDDSAIRAVHREGIVLLGGGRALLMQIAHPAVAAGVAEHSSFRADRIGRLVRTLRPTLTIVFGTETQAREAARAVNAVHERVVGEGYRAGDPALLAWVLATLIDTALDTYRRFVGPLERQVAENYYADMRRAGLLLRVPPDELPPGLAAFRAYRDEMLSRLEVSPVARRLERELFAPSPSLLSPPMMRGLRALTAALLPPALRAQYGYRWGPGRASVLRVAESLGSAVWPMLPAELRSPPAVLLPPGAREAPSEGREAEPAAPTGRAPGSGAPDDPTYTWRRRNNGWVRWFAGKRGPGRAEA